MPRGGSPRPAAATPRVGAVPPVPNRSSLEAYQARAAYHEWIRAPLATDRRGHPVPGIQRKLVAERNESRHRRIERVAIGERQIRATDGACEQAVAAKDRAVIVERDVPWCVSRYVHDRKLLRSHAHAIALPERAIRRRRSIDADAESQRGVDGYFVQRSFERVHVHENGMRAQHPREPAEMVEMRVRQPYALERGARRAQSIIDARRLVAWIDQHRAIGRLVDEEITILLKWSDGQRLNL